MHVGDPDPDNGPRVRDAAHESCRTGDPRIYLDVADAFMAGAAHEPVDVKVTYRDFARRDWRLVYRAADATTAATPIVRGRPAGHGSFRTVTFRIAAPGFDDGLAGGTDLALEALDGNLEASFVRIVKR